jgi:multiple sugar transport system permease protein
MIIQTGSTKTVLSALSVALGSTPTTAQQRICILGAGALLPLEVLWLHVILWLAGLSAIPDSYYEAARVDRANEMQCFFHITLPQLGDLFITSVLALINSFKVFARRIS